MGAQGVVTMLDKLVAVRPITENTAKRVSRACTGHGGKAADVADVNHFLPVLFK